MCYNNRKFPLYYIPKKRQLMIQICRKDKKKGYEAIRKGIIDSAEMSFPNLIDDIILTLKKRGLTDLLVQALPDKRRDNSHIPFDILLCPYPRAVFLLFLCHLPQKGVYCNGINEKSEVLLCLLTHNSSLLPCANIWRNAW
jgi:hypothetical protein